MNSVVLINKPSGMTSFKVTAAVRKKLNIKKAGHAGTLDPLASGVLPVYTGSATRFIDLPQSNMKRYTAGFTLGVTTDTLDCEGEVQNRCDVCVSKEDLLNLFPCFTGEVTQIPPMYSAIKQNGVPLYKLARQGKTVEVKSRVITIHSLELLSFDGVNGVFDVLCSKGTYIRTLIADIGEKLGCGAHMTSLERTLSNGYTLDDCVSLDDFLNSPDDAISGVHPADFAVKDYPSAKISDNQERLFRNGGGLFFSRVKTDGDAEFYRVYAKSGFVGLGVKSEDGELLNPKYIMM